MFRKLARAALPVGHLRRRLSRSAADGVLPRETRQLLIDVSIIAQHDARTGIQRVVRGIVDQLIRHPPKSFIVRPVACSRQHGYRYSSYRPTDAALVGRNVHVHVGDVFLGLDLAAHLIPRHHAELAGWKRKGVSMNFVVYDLLPLLHPEWFVAKTTRNFKRWIRTVAILADRVICISDVVKADMTRWLADEYNLVEAVDIATIRMGADITPGAACRPAVVDGRPTVLMVGTVEPRKGYDQVVASFECLWRDGHDIDLVIVGKPGWKTEVLQQSLRTHVEAGCRLRWFDDADDVLLAQLYAEADGVIVASYGEGYGLPLVEALRYGKPVLARDIPVFHEVGGDAVRYFRGETPEQLAAVIPGWLAAPKQSCPPPSCVVTWGDSTSDLLRLL